MNIHSIKFKMFIGILIIMVTGSIGIIYTINNSFTKNIDKLAEDVISGSKSTFDNFIDNDAKVLSSTLYALKDNKEIISIFSEHDQSKLYSRTKMPFETLKTKYGITHWYFINPEGTQSDANKCFLRVHDINKSGDVIERVTFKNAVKNKLPASGIELGKTAFALRVVSPFYHNGKLVGYMELGEEIEHIFSLMKSQTKADYGLLVDKQYLNRENWKSVRKSKGLSDSWEERSNTVLISSTTNDEHLLHFGGTITEIPDNGKLLEQIKKEDKYFARGIIPLYDAANRKVGGIFVLYDITTQYASIQSTRVFTVLFIVIITAVIAAVILLMLNRLVIKRIHVMTEKATAVAGGDYKTKIEKSQDDEIGEFEVLFEQFRVLFVILLEKIEGNETTTALTEQNPENVNS